MGRKANKQIIISLKGNMVVHYSQTEVLADINLKHVHEQGLTDHFDPSSSIIIL